MLSDILVSSKIDRPIVLSIAGLDPSAGAGLLSDIKCIEALRCYGLGVATAITYQNDINFDGLNWCSTEEIKLQLDSVLKRYRPTFVKVGLVSSLEELNNILDSIDAATLGVPVIWDPILKASAGYQFHTFFDPIDLQSILKRLFAITPNIPELQVLAGERDSSKAASDLSKYCRVVLKGGHNEAEDRQPEVIDSIFFEGQKKFEARRSRLVGSKHGTGCVFSSAFTSYLALGKSLEESLRCTGEYIARFINSCEGLLGYHRMSLRAVGNDAASVYNP